MNDMNITAKRLFNALAFANVSNLGEFRALLRQIDEPDTPVHRPAQPAPNDKPGTNEPVIGHVQGAL